MSDTISITAVTVTFNGMAFLEGFFNSLFATDQQGIHLEVILVDNGSTDGTVEWVRGNFPQVRVIENDENNYARALNVAIANSTSDYVVITNNDAMVHPDWLQGFLTIFRRDDKIGAVQSKIFFSSCSWRMLITVPDAGRKGGSSGTHPPAFSTTSTMGVPPRRSASTFVRATGFCLWPSIFRWNWWNVYRPPTFSKKVSSITSIVPCFTRCRR